MLFNWIYKMLKSGKTSRLGDYIRDWMLENRIERNIAEFHVKRDWEKIAGSYIAKATENMFFSNEILYVKITSSVLKQELMMIRSQIVGKINKEYYQGLIKEIRII